jgi:hypothetical protein
MRALRVLTEPNQPHGRIELEAAVLHLFPTPPLSTAPLPVIARPAVAPVRVTAPPRMVIAPPKPPPTPKRESPAARSVASTQTRPTNLSAIDTASGKAEPPSDPSFDLLTYAQTRL